MELEDMLLDREEVLINEAVGGISALEEGRTFNDTMFEAHLITQIPIHPLIPLLPEEVRYDQGIALESINQALEWFYEDMEKHAPQSQIVNQRISPKEKWEPYDTIPIGEANFPRGRIIYIMAARDGGDARLGLDEDELESWVNFSPEKVKEYTSKETPRGKPVTNFWRTTNADYLSDHIFLRAWAVAYHNTLLTKAISE
jgi:hypothetical protein